MPQTTFQSRPHRGYLIVGTRLLSVCVFTFIFLTWAHRNRFDEQNKAKIAANFDTAAAFLIANAKNKNAEMQMSRKRRQCECSLCNLEALHQVQHQVQRLLCNVCWCNEAYALQHFRRREHSLQQLLELELEVGVRCYVVKCSTQSTRSGL